MRAPPPVSQLARYSAAVLTAAAAPASSGGRITGRGVAGGQVAPSGQLAENHSTARAARPVNKSAPSRSEASFFESPNTLHDSVVSDRPVAAWYASASDRICEMIVMAADTSVKKPESSTVALPDDTASLTATIPNMLADVVARIHQRLNALGLSAHAASMRAGRPDAIRNMERGVSKGRAGVSTKTLEALAPVLQTTVAWLSDGIGPADLGTRRVPLLGFVGLGSEVTLYLEHEGATESVACPTTAPTARAAIEIRGACMGAFFDRWLAFYGPRIDRPGDDILGELCIVGLADGRQLVKKVAAGGLPDRFTLLSQFEPPIYDPQVEWAAVIVALQPR